MFKDLISFFRSSYLMLDFQNFFMRPSYDVAQDLIGCELFVHGAGGIIVETEAYERDDPASHSYRGPNKKNTAMFGSSGCAYVYQCYGIHWCFNMVCLPGSAILIRSLEPTEGLLHMQEKRSCDRVSLLCSGPARLCQALSIDKSLNGMPLNQSPFLVKIKTNTSLQILQGSRIGIRFGLEKQWRFGLAGSFFLSKRF